MSPEQDAAPLNTIYLRSGGQLNRPADNENVDNTRGIEAVALL